jgi:alkylation response protein AidB-like acyl-CoA dehydrogenase
MQATREPTVAAEDYLGRVQEILPQIRDAAPSCEAARQLTPEIAELLREAGAFAVAVPRSWGGPELDPVTHARGIEMLSAADASAGWCAMIGCDTGYFSAYLDEPVARELFVDLTAATATVVNPTGAAVPTEGGYTVTGRWAFASGCTHAKVFTLGCLVPTDAGPRMLAPGQPEIRLVVIPASQAEIMDTWTTTGVRGSGSHDVAVTNLFVPAERSFSLFNEPSRRPGPLYKLRTLFVSKMGGVPLGIARGAIDDVLAVAHTRRAMGSLTPVAEQDWLQTAIAQAEMKLGQARAFYYESLAKLWDELQAGEATKDTRARLHLSVVGTLQSCTEIVDSMYRAGGSSALYAPKTLDRRLRDIHTIGQHVIFAHNGVADAGKVILSLPVTGSLVFS